MENHVGTLRHDRSQGLRVEDVAFDQLHWKLLDQVQLRGWPVESHNVPFSGCKLHDEVQPQKAGATGHECCQAIAIHTFGPRQMAWGLLLEFMRDWGEACRNEFVLNWAPKGIATRPNCGELFRPRQTLSLSLGRNASDVIRGRPVMTTSQPPTALIEVRLSRPEQLFNSLDPSPFHERDLDDDAEEYIVGWARELPAGAAIHVLVHLPEHEIQRANEIGLEVAFTNYFAYRASMIERDLREVFRMGWRYLSIGVIVLLLCLMGSQFLESNLGTSPLARVLQESLIIVGWVANWRPIETFLYDWWPPRRRFHLYRQLEKATVEIGT